MLKKLRKFFDREQNLLIHIIASILVIIFGFIFKVSNFEWVMILLMISFVITSELLNSAIEIVVDIYTNKFNPLAKVAKDTASAAVVISAFTALLVGICIFAPKILTLLK